MDLDECKNVNDFNFAEETLTFAKEAYLRKAGWTSSSNTPGCYVMWRKMVDGFDWFVDFDTAWRMQGILEADAAGEDEASE